jgi:tetratricopeptide (TPR) repeat protein
MITTSNRAGRWEGRMDADTAVEAELRRRIESRQPAAMLADDLADEIAELERTLAGGPIGAEHVPLLAVLGEWHWSRYQLLPAVDDNADLGAAVWIFEALLRHDAALVPAPVRQYLVSQPDADSLPTAIATNLAIALMNEYQSTGQLPALSAAVDSFRKAVLTAAPDNANKGTYLSNLASATAMRFQRTGATTDLDAAIHYGQQAVAAVPAGHPDRASALSNVGTALRLRFERTGSRTDLAQAIDAGREAAEAVSHPVDQALYLGNLGAALSARYQLTDDIVDLREAVAIVRRPADAVPAGHPDRALHLSDLAVGLGVQARRTGSRHDVDEAVTAAREAVACTPVGQPRRTSYLANLGEALSARFRRTGDLADLDEAIDAGRQAVAATPDGHTRLAGHLSNLGSDLRARFERTGDDADLAEAVCTGRQAVEQTPPGQPDLPRRLTNLGLALAARFHRTAASADLDAAIDLARQAVAALPDGHVDLAGMRSNLGDLLGIRFDNERSGADLDEAITTTRTAIAAMPVDHPDRVAPLSNLANMLFRRFHRAGADADLDEAIAVARQAIGDTPDDHPDQARCLSNLGLMVGHRFERSGDPADSDEHLTAARRALAVTPAKDPDHARHLANIALALTMRYRHTADAAELDDAITTYRQAADEIPADHPDRAPTLAGLGNALVLRLGRTALADDLHEALACRQQTAALTSAPVSLRIDAALTWGGLAHVTDMNTSAADGYAAAVRLLPELVWHGLDQVTKEELLADRRGLATDAAALAIIADRPDSAAEVLEQGRSVLWQQALRLRGDLSALAAAHRDLAARLDTVRTALDRPFSTPGLAEPAGRSGRTVDPRRMAREWDELLAEVHALEGFETFLTPTPYQELRASAVGGPVITVNAGRMGCHALVLTSQHAGIRVLDLPGVDHAAVVGHVGRFLGVLDRARTPDTTDEQRETDRHAVLDMLEWLWTAVVGPILDALTDWGVLPTAGGPAPPPRLWWCPTGQLARLPLHAAGIHARQAGEATDDAFTAAGRVVSSYTPTLTALLRARRSKAVRPVRQLAVGVRDAPGVAPIPGVRAEMAALSRHLGSERSTLLDEAATREQVLARLPDVTWLHLACHGVQHPDDPSMSAFALGDGPLTIATLAELDLEHAELAYLSACETATGDVRLLDEAVHLAGAMQLVGFRHVIATQWAVNDIAARRVMNDVYGTLTRSGAPDATSAAIALHGATSGLRARYPGQPLVWAPYIHLGA